MSNSPTGAGTDPKRRTALGKGLESLLGPRPGVSIAASATPAPAEPTGKPLEIPVDRIERNPYQTRSAFDPEKLNELAASIKASGVVQPIVVREIADGKFQLIMGERRWRASQIAGKPTVPAIVRQVSNEQAMEMTIIENLQRADLNPMEQARAFARLSREFSLTQEQMAERTGKDRASVGNFLRLLKLPEEVQAMVESGELSFGHARALLALESGPEIVAAAKKITALNLSVRTTENYIKSLLNPEPNPPKPEKIKDPLDPNVREARDLIQRRLGLRIQIDDKHGKGRVIIEYANVDDFDAILRALGE
ncbi:MAG TPA: ParB/RepB/Spo0J family partition protein [Acidobacteriaceae bacterium]|jgi:ParB family chromosome partitioning protein|nr:ParB/RepB/Spo0J family partition protein [Acidobacteriaceae bacterium]